MKKVKYMIIGALMTIISAPAMAQDEVNPIQKQAETILKSDVDAKAKQKQVDLLYKEHKNEIGAIVGIGNAFLAQKDYANAKKYAQMAVDFQLKKKLSDATPYILMGNIAVAQDDAGEAATQFQQAMVIDKKNPDGYRRYAQIMSKIDPQGSVQTLEALRAELPNYPVDLIAAEIYNNAGKIDQANEYYAKVSVDQMKDYHIYNYSLNLYLKQDYVKAAELAAVGHKKDPRSAAFNTLLLQSYVDAKNFDAALVAGKDLFENSDSLKANARSYAYYAKAFEGKEKYAEAIEIYKKLDADNSIKAEEKLFVNKNISDDYKKLSDYTNAELYLNKYIDAHEKVTFDLREMVAEMWASQLRDANSSQEVKDAAFAKADAIYEELGKKYPENLAYAEYMRTRLVFSRGLSDIDALKGAGPRYETIVEFCEKKADLSDGEKKMQKEALTSTAQYYVYCVKDYAKAKTFAEKLLSIDPENAVGKGIMEIK